MKNRIITISREYGSGGSIVAKKLGKELQLKVYDEEILQLIADDCGFDVKYIADVVEKLKLGNSFDITTCLGFCSNSFTCNCKLNGDDIFSSINNVIRNLAKEGDCIIVGRCADYILKDRKDVLNVFLYSSYDDRRRRVVDEYGLNEEKASDEMKKQDRFRARYYNYYCERKWATLGNYSIMLNVGKMGIDGCVEVLKEAFQKGEEKL